MIIPQLSIVIPVKNASKTIKYCLDAIFANEAVDFDVTVVDDGCSDNTMDIVSKYNCRRLKNSVQRGVSGARNTGAFASRGEVLVFVDADVVVQKDTLSRISQKIQNRKASAIIGMLQENIRFNNFSSQYKNLWMNYTFNNLPDNISLIFSSIAAIKREAFLNNGGFDINYKAPSVEDNELGIKLSRTGCYIILDKTLQVEHLKKYSLFSLLKTHYSRAKGLIKLFNRSRTAGSSKNNPSSVPNFYFFNILLIAALAFLILSFIFQGNSDFKIVVLFSWLLLLIFVNRKWLFFLTKKRGMFFAVKSLFYLPVELIVIVCGLISGQAEYFLGKKY